jgi:type VI secretion protein, EvpB/VC_A0108 family
MDNVQEQAETGGQTVTLSVLDRIIQEGRMARDELQQTYARDMLEELATQILDEGMAIESDTVAMINHRIAQIDALISDQLNEVLHHPDMQKLEASWRGLHQFVMNTETSTRLKLRLLNVSRKELQEDLEKAVEFDQSTLFKKLYEDEYGTFGGNPYSVLVGDFEFGRHPQDVALLEKISQVAAAAHAPFIASASPRLFDMGSFAELNVPRDLAKIFESTELIKWRAFRESDDSRYVSLVLPHVLQRLPYGPDTVPVEGVNFVEDVDGLDASKYLWGNAAWVLANRITEAFALYGWCAAIRGAEGAGWWKAFRRTPSPRRPAISACAARRRSPSPTAVRKSLTISGLSRCAIRKIPTPPRSLAGRPPIRPGFTTRRRPTPTRGSRQCCRTSLPRPALRTT